MPHYPSLFIVFWAAPGKVQALEAELHAMVDVAATESGTLVYSIHRVAGERDGVAVYEVYRDAAAQTAHGLSDGIARLRERLGDLLAAPPERFDLRLCDGAKGLPDAAGGRDGG